MNKRRQLILATGALALYKPLKALASWFKPEANTQASGQAFYKLAKLEEQLKASGSRYLPFLNVEKLKTGLYALPAGSTDRQQPHTDDEVYYVIKGKAMFKAGEESTQIEPGDVLYVKAQVEHRFYEIEEDLEILVFFSNMK